VANLTNAVFAAPFLMATGTFLANGARPTSSRKFGLEIYSLRREPRRILWDLALIRKFELQSLK